MFKQFTLFQKLILGISSALILSIALSTGLSNNLLQTMLDERLNERELPTALREIRNDISLSLADPLITSKNLSENTFITHWMNLGEPEDSQADIINHLTHLKDSHLASTAFLVSSQTGNYYNENGLLKTLSTNNERDQWFYDALKSNAPYTIGLDISESTGTPTVFINYLLKVNGQINGIAGLGKPLAEMSKLINQYRIGQTGTVMLVENTGVIQLHADSSNSGKPLASLNGNSDLSELLSNQEYTSLHTHIKGEDYIAASLPLSNLNSRIIALVPYSELYSELTAITTKTSLFAFFIAFLFIAASFFLFRALIKPILVVSKALNEIGNQGGDLTRRLKARGNDELAALAFGFNSFVEALHHIVKDAISISGHLKESNQSVINVVSETVHISDDQQQKTDMVAAAINEMASTVSEIANNAGSAAQAAKQAKQESDNGRKVLGEAVDSINKMAGSISHSTDAVNTLAEDITSINSVLDVIKGISEQTNLLALNAAIEAARAGEQGRGFAVVADEVRTLAQKTQESTEEIQNMIERLQSSAQKTVESMSQGQKITQQGVEAANKASNSIGIISDSIDAINGMNQQVAVATEEQSNVTEEITANVVAIAELSERCKEEITKSKTAASTATDLTEQLEKAMGRFSV